MGGTADFVLSITIVLVILIIIAFIWYNFTGWSPFKYSKGNTVTFKTPDESSIAYMRFRNCIFTFTDPKGSLHSIDVTEVLNNMAKGFRDAQNPPSSFTLGGHCQAPLNAFSFVLPGVNDRATVTTSEDAKKWENCDATLTGLQRII